MLLIYELRNSDTALNELLVIMRSEAASFIAAGGTFADLMKSVVVLLSNSSKSLSSLEDEGSRFLRNVAIRLQSAAAARSRRAKSQNM
jgi:hypothetical protein